MGTFFHLRRPSWSRRFTLLAAASLGALTLGGVAAAESTTITHLPFAAGSFNPCTAEAIAVDGFLHFQISFRTSADGSVNFHLEVNWQNTKGVTLTGAKYVLNNEFSDHFNDIPPGQTVNAELMTHFIRQKEVDGVLVLDPGDDFFLDAKTQFVVNANGVVTVNNIELPTGHCQ